MVEDHAQFIAVFFFDLLELARHQAARRTLEVAEFLNRHCRLRFTANMDAGCRATFGTAGGCDSLGSIKCETAAEGRDGDESNNQIRQIPLHREPKENHWSANASKLSRAYRRRGRG